MEIILEGNRAELEDAVIAILSIADRGYVISKIYPNRINSEEYRIYLTQISFNQKK